VDSNLLLASSPSNFENSRSFECSDTQGTHFGGQKPWTSSPFAATNKGVQISLPVIENQPVNSFPKLLGQGMQDYEKGGSGLCSFAVLRCYQLARKDEYVAIPLNCEKRTIATYTRRGTWLVSVPASCVTDMAVVKQILIRTDTKIHDTGLYERLFNRRLIIIQPLPVILDPVTFVRILCVDPEVGSLYGKPHFHDNGAISIMSPFQYVYFDDVQFYRDNPLILAFKSSQGAMVLISVAPTENDTIMATISCSDGEDDGGWYNGQATRNILECEHRQMISKMPASDSDTAFVDVSAHVKESDHAWIVTIETM
jgi:hypothetical protein